MFARYVARRYLFSPKSRSVINLISGLSVVAIAMPVAAMIILLSVFNGFERLVRMNGSAFEADLTVEPVRGQTFRIGQLDTAALSHVAGIAARSFVLEQGVLIERDGRTVTTTVRGVDADYAALFPIAEAVQRGEYRVQRGDLEWLVVGRAAAQELGIRSLADAEVSLYALRRSSFSTLLPMEAYTRRRVPVAGIYTLDLDTEQRYVLTSLRLAQGLFAWPDRASALLLRVEAGADVAHVRDAVARAVGGEFRVETHAERNAAFYAVMKYEKWGIFFIALLVLIIASFSIVGALAMLITDKREDIATLRALGAPVSEVRRLFGWEGAYVCGLGAAIGAVIGLGAVLLQQHFGLIEIPADSFLTKSYPVELRMGDLLSVAVSVAVVAAVVTRITVRNMIRGPKDGRDDETNAARAVARGADKR